MGQSMLLLLWSYQHGQKDPVKNYSSNEAGAVTDYLITGLLSCFSLAQCEQSLLCSQEGMCCILPLRLQIYNLLSVTNMEFHSFLISEILKTQLSKELEGLPSYWIYNMVPISILRLVWSQFWYPFTSICVFMTWVCLSLHVIGPVWSQSVFLAQFSLCIFCPVWPQYVCFWPDLVSLCVFYPVWSQSVDLSRITQRGTEREWERQNLWPQLPVQTEGPQSLKPTVAMLPLK